MGNLKPGATYIYEKANGVTYARESGAGPNTRFPIGWDHSHVNSVIEDAHLWLEIRRAAETDATLKNALEAVKILYHLSKNKDGQE